MKYPMLSAAEFVAQGTTPGQILGMAKRNPERAEDFRAAARAVSNLTGMPLRYRRAHNDNRHPVHKHRRSA
jgi:hypothetical protein